VLFSSHHLHQVQQVCDRVGLFVNGKLLAEGNIQSLSQKLFANSAYIVEVAVGDKDVSAKWLAEKLKDINGFVAIKEKEEMFEVECSRDITSEVARILVNTGALLTYLRLKEYGLDDIYYRYFEGGEANGQ